MLTVPGSAPLDLTFDYVYKGGCCIFQNEVALFNVDDAQGAIGSLNPGDAGYLAAAYQRAQIVFPGGSTASVADKVLSFQGGDRLVLMLINSTLADLQAHNPNNSPSSTPHAFFSLDVLNPDGLDHMLGFVRNDGARQFGLEDLFNGDQDFDDVTLDVNTPLVLDASDGFEPLPQTYGPCDGGLDALNQSGCWRSVNTLLGAYTTEATDASMPAIGIPFAYTRSYTSANTNTGRLGAGWNDSYSASIGVQPNGDALVIDENGQQIYFTKQPDGTFAAPQGGVASLTAAGGGYQLLNTDQTKLSFDSNGRLLSIKDRNSQGVTLAYDPSGNLQTVTDSVGRAVTFTPNGDGTLHKATLPDGRHVDFGYTAGRLTSVTDLRAGVTIYGYDPSGLLATVTDQNQKTVVTNHYTNGRIDSQTDALGHQTSFGWDAGSQTATITDERGHAWTHAYQNNILVRTIDPLGNTTSYGYDAGNNLTGIKDPRGNTTLMTYNSQHEMLTRTAPAPLSYQESWTYNSFNDPLSYQDRRGQTTSYGYDAAGNLTSKTLPDPDGPGGFLTAPVIQYGRDPAGTGLLVSETDANNKTTLYGYDGQGNRTSLTTPLSEKTTMGYDTVGRLTSRVDPRGNVTGCGCAAAHTTTYGYDDANHLTSQTDPGLPAKTWLYDPAGNQQRATDENGHQTAYGYDDNERLNSVTAADTTSITAYDYDNFGNLAHRTDPKGHVTGYGYDNANRLTTLTLPTITTPATLTPIWTYAYDAAGNRTTELDPNGSTATTAYDQLNRPTQVSYSGGAATPTVGFSYDGNDNRTQLVDGDGTLAYTYDNDNRLTNASRTHTGGGSDSFSYGYDAAGNVINRTYPDGTFVAYTPDSDERLSTVATSGTTISYGYDPAGNPTTTTLPTGNGYVETHVYDNANRLIEVKNAKGATVLSDFAQTLDNAGNPLTITRTGATNSTTVYGYDTRDRLTSVCLLSTCSNSFDPKIAWTYDSVGNRLTEARGASTATYTYNQGDQLLQAATTYFANPYATAVESDAAQPYWRLGEASGTSFASATGSFGGTWTGSPALGVAGALNGDTNKAVSLSGNSQVGTVPSSTGINKTNNFTIELWLKRTKNASSQAVVGKPLTTTTKSENYAIWLDTANKARFEVGAGNKAQTVTCTLALDTNWRQITATFASPTLTIYQDGTACGTANATFSTAATNTNSLNIGLSGTTNYGGSIDELALYNTALTAAQITSHYTKGHNPPPAPQNVGYAYDNNGNQTLAGNRGFTYDAADRLASTTSGTTTDTYSYDGDDNRLRDANSSTTIKSIWDTNNALPELALERDGAGNLLRRYTYGAGIGPLSMTTPAGSFYYHHDTLRNIANLTDASGNNQWTYSYEPYGTATATPTGSPPSNPIQYNAQYRDNTGLYNLRAREYDPETGLFNRLDPKQSDVTTPYESSYGYANDDPINNYDPSGEMPIPPNPCVTQHVCGGSTFGGLAHFVAKHKLEFAIAAGMVVAAFVAPQLEPLLATAAARAVVAARVGATAAAGTANKASRLHNAVPGGASWTQKLGITAAEMIRPAVVRAARITALSASIWRNARRYGR